MNDKQYDPARHNEEAPQKGMAAVNTHNPEEEVSGQEETMEDEKEKRRRQNNMDNNRT